MVERAAVFDTRDVLDRYGLRPVEGTTVTGHGRTHRYRRGDGDHTI